HADRGAGRHHRQPRAVRAEGQRPRPGDAGRVPRAVRRRHLRRDHAEVGPDRRDGPRTDPQRRNRRGRAMTAAAVAPEHLGTDDVATSRRRVRPWRWVTGAVLAVLAAQVLAFLVGNERFEWDVVAQYLFEP